jgi:hypothetical protein
MIHGREERKPYEERGCLEMGGGPARAELNSLQPDPEFGSAHGAKMAAYECPLGRVECSAVMRLRLTWNPAGRPSYAEYEYVDWYSTAYIIQCSI